MEAYYGECRRPDGKKGRNFDGCQEFLITSSFDGRDKCYNCGCCRHHHRKVVPKVKKVVVEYKTEVLYTKCQKIHVHNAVDGCQEFVLSTMEDLSCATCGCDKNFHRNEITTSTTTTTSSK